MSPFEGFYLNQNMEGLDIPPGQLMKPSDNPAGVKVPYEIQGGPNAGKWVVLSFESGSPYPCRDIFDSREDAISYGRQRLNELGLKEFERF